MAWYHYEIRSTGIIWFAQMDRLSEASFEIGVSFTGKQRVFHSYFINVIHPDGLVTIGMDRHNLRDALFDVAKQLAQMGYTLAVAGLDDRFYETGLSHNSGLGYIDELGRIGMMEPV